VGDPQRLPVTSWLEAQGQGAAVPTAEPQERIVGTLVHRLFQFGDTQPAVTLLRPEERAMLPDVDAVAARAVEAWYAMRTRPDVTALLASGTRDYEVPFSMKVAAGEEHVILRGTIDCLVRRTDGVITVVEFKTGARRAAHEQQLAIYTRAVQRLFPAARVDSALIYAAGEPGAPTR
jgi:ATP-dependent exoDNAse (exonuclease V) beta subunit